MCLVALGWPLPVLGGRGLFLSTPNRGCLCVILLIVCVLYLMRRTSVRLYIWDGGNFHCFRWLIVEMIYLSPEVTLGLWATCPVPVWYIYPRQYGRRYGTGTGQHRVGGKTSVRKRTIVFTINEAILSICRGCVFDYNNRMFVLKFSETWFKDRYDRFSRN